MEGQSHNTRISKRQGRSLFFFQSDIVEHFAQGFAVADDEIQMDLAAFRQHYANNTGGVE